MIDELKGAIASAKDGGRKPARLLLKHGPALIKAVELAEAVDAYDHEGVGDRLLETDPLSTPELQAAYKALDAYRAAKKEAK